MGSLDTGFIKQNTIELWDLLYKTEYHRIMGLLDTGFIKQNTIELWDPWILAL